MLKAIMLGLGIVGIGAAGFAGTKYLGATQCQEVEVVCCGQCKAGDDCLKKCEAKSQAPEGSTLICCGSCEKGQNCAEQCGAAPKKASCCDAGN